MKGIGETRRVLTSASQVLLPTRALSAAPAGRGRGRGGSGPYGGTGTGIGRGSDTPPDGEEEVGRPWKPGWGYVAEGRFADAGRGRGRGRGDIPAAYGGAGASGIGTGSPYYGYEEGGSRGPSHSGPGSQAMAEVEIAERLEEDKRGTKIWSLSSGMTVTAAASSSIGRGRGAVPYGGGGTSGIGQPRFGQASGFPANGDEEVFRNRAPGHPGPWKLESSGYGSQETFAAPGGAGHGAIYGSERTSHTPGAGRGIIYSSKETPAGVECSTCYGGEENFAAPGTGRGRIYGNEGTVAAPAAAGRGVIYGSEGSFGAPVGAGRGIIYSSSTFGAGRGRIYGSDTPYGDKEALGSGGPRHSGLEKPKGSGHDSQGNFASPGAGRGTTYGNERTFTSPGAGRGAIYGSEVTFVATGAERGATYGSVGSFLAPGAGRGTIYGSEGTFAPGTGRGQVIISSGEERYTTRQADSPHFEGLACENEETYGTGQVVHQEQDGVYIHERDYYSQTFKPVMQPATDYEFGLDRYQTGYGVSSGTEDTSAELYGDYKTQVPREHSREEEGDRAIKILEERLMMSRRRIRVEQWEKSQGEDASYQRRTPVDILQSKAPRGSRESRTREQASTRRLRPQQEQQKKKELGAESAQSESKRTFTEEEQEQLRQDLEKRSFRDSLMLIYDKFIYKSLHFMGSMMLEPEYIMGDFTKNPDIDEKPLPSLEERLEKAKPHFIKAGLIEDEWQVVIKHVLKNAPIIEEFVEEFSGPGRYTAKEENEDLEAIASALPSDVGPKLQGATQRALTTLKYNPGMNLDEKQWLLANMVKEFSQYQYAQS